MGGIDGCRAGWVLATAPAGVSTGGDSEAPGVEVAVIADLGPLVTAVRSGVIVAAGIDIPIGLPAHGPRRCDVEARRLLGSRRSSVFPAPVRAVLGAETYEDACTRSRSACGKAISRQLFNILPKIREVDAAMAAAPVLRDHLFEMCPELSFAAMAGGKPMAHAKRTQEGRAERRAALCTAFGDLEVLTGKPPAGAAPDDVLDAVATLWSARRHAAGDARRLGGKDGDDDGDGDGGQLDETGLRMEIVA